MHHQPSHPASNYLCQRRSKIAKMSPHKSAHKRSQMGLNSNLPEVWQREVMASRPFGLHRYGLAGGGLDGLCKQQTPVVAAAANRGGSTPVSESVRPIYLLHNPQNQLGAGGDGEFFEQAVQMRVNGVPRNFEPLGNSSLRKIVKNALDNLQLALRKAQGAGIFKPSIFAEE